ncbi:paired amphipathic helix protein [Medicago truncatula]|uniref:Paired amphipathic helix protein n=1 Tax=Medicago truncatula TaxID=3880 RepID=A0A072UVI8_MEDTR|nr:paired amphipathic helix protein [Medicago truncatula]
MYRQKEKSLDEVIHEVAVLFEGHDDLIDGFQISVEREESSATIDMMKSVPMAANNSLSVSFSDGTST